METLRDLDVVRAAPITTVLRAIAPADDTAATDDGLGVMVVRFSVFDEWYEIDSFWEGEFLERMAKGAFKKTMRESGSSVKCLFNHGMDFNIGDKMLCMPEDLREDADAAVLEGNLFDTSYNRDLLPAIRAGAYGSSFMFRVVRDSWNKDPGVSDYNPKGIPERTIKEVRLFEAGPVTFPANPAATAGMRSATDAYYELVRSRDPQRYNDLRSRVLALRTPTADAAQRAEPLDTSAEGAAIPSTDAPDLAVVEASDHPTGLIPAQRAARLRELRYDFLKESA